MHAAGTGPIKTVVALGFVVVIPLIAVFGLPERESVVASSGGDDAQRVHHRSIGVGESASYRSDDLFADFPHDAAVKADSAPVENPLAVTISASDPFQASPSMAAGSNDPFVDPAQPVPATALAGWSLERPSNTSPRQVGGFASQFAAGPANGNSRGVSGVRPMASGKIKSAAPMPRDIESTRPVPRDGASQTKPGPQRFHHRTESSQRPSVASKGVPGAKSPMPQTWRAAVRRLNELGIHHFRLEPGGRPNEFHFHCSFTPSDTPRITQRFEAEAAEPLRAVQKVIAQVEQWLQRR